MPRPESLEAFFSTTSTSVRMVSPGRTGLRNLPRSTARSPSTVPANSRPVIAVENDMVRWLGQMRPPYGVVFA